MILNEIISGFFVGLTQIAVGHPFNTTKVLIQNKQKWFGLPIKNYYLGLAYPLYGQIIKNSLTFDMNSRLVNMNITNNFVTGGITGMYMSPILYYIDVFKIRRQTGTSLRFYDFINYNFGQILYSIFGQIFEIIIFGPANYCIFRAGELL